jgi:hypothetical protein
MRWASRDIGGLSAAVGSYSVMNSQRAKETEYRTGVAICSMTSWPAARSVTKSRPETPAVCTA